MDIGYGFVRGYNKISKQKICYWLHSDQDITWDVFVWYIADYCEIKDYGEDWIIVKLKSPKHRQFFYERARNYHELMCSSNFDVDCGNDLWKSHKSGAKDNYDILESLVRKHER